MGVKSNRITVNSGNNHHHAAGAVEANDDDIAAATLDVENHVGGRE